MDMKYEIGMKYEIDMKYEMDMVIVAMGIQMDIMRRHHVSQRTSALWCVYA